MRISLFPYFVLGALLLGLATGYYVRDLRADRDTAAALAKQANTHAQALALHAEDLEDMNQQNAALRDRIATLDTDHTDQRNAYLEENARLRGDVAVAQRMRLQGTTCHAAPAQGDPAGAGSVGDAAGIELSGETRLAVWDLRAALIADRAKVNYLQDYIRSACSD